MRQRHVAARLAAYLAALFVLGCLLVFHDLDGQMVCGDEAIYARVSNNMVRSGDWWYPHLSPDIAVFDKPPLYCWLTALTKPLFGEAPTVYRFWSASFGVAAVLLTCVLGHRLFGPEVGFLAGALLLTNRNFLFVWGARSGVFDTMVVFLTVASALLYLRADTARRRWVCWLGVGGCIAAICMLKQLAGYPILALWAGHHLLVDRTLPRWKRLAGPSAAGALATLLILPWHLSQWWHFGDAFLKDYFGGSLLQRATEGLDPWHLHGSWFYFESLTEGSAAFALYGPAWVVAVLLAWHGVSRREFAFVAGVPAVILGLISIPVSKLTHYAYPAYPFLAVVLAAVAALGVRAAAGALRVRFAVEAVACAVVVAGLGWSWYTLRAEDVPAYRCEYAPLLVYRRAEPLLRAGDCRVVLFRFQSPDLFPQTARGFDHTDVFHLDQMRGCRWVDDLPALKSLLADGTPTLVFLPEGESVQQVAATQGRGIVPYAPIGGARSEFSLLSFHGAADRIHARRGDSARGGVVR